MPMNAPALRDAALLIFRVVVGIIFVAHGYNTLYMGGISHAYGQFSQWHVPQPKLSVWVTALGELIGGAVLILGLLTSIVAGLLGLLMIGAGYFAHRHNGFFITQGGFEYVALLAASCLLIVIFGPGRASLDGVLTRDDQP